MKKIMIVAGLLCAFCTGSQAGDEFFSTEKSEEGTKAELRAGLTVSQMVAVESGASTKGYRRLGYNVGIIVETPIVESLAFQTGLQFVQKGLKEETSISGTLTESISNPSYLELPLLASYRHDFRKKIRLQVNTGPFLAMGLFGKMKLRQEDAQGNMYTVGEVDWFGSAADTQSAQFKRFDMGWHVGARLRFANKISVGYAFEAGFVDTGRSTTYSVKTRSHLVNLGFTL